MSIVRATWEKEGEYLASNPSSKARVGDDIIGEGVVEPWVDFTLAPQIIDPSFTLAHSDRAASSILIKL